MLTLNIFERYGQHFYAYFTGRRRNTAPKIKKNKNAFKTTIIYETQVRRKFSTSFSFIKYAINIEF